MKETVPLLTIGLVSCNRLHYLRATLESARRCLRYPRIQWIVIDNASTEPGLREYLQGCDWIETLIFRKERSPLTEHTVAMNEIVSLAKGEVLMIWPEDVQFIVEGDWIQEVIELLLRNDDLGNVHLGPLRRKTIRQYLGLHRFKNWRGMLEEWKRYGGGFRFQKQIDSSRGFRVSTMGWTMEGIAGAGIVSVSRTSMWKKLGPWMAKNQAIEMGDSSGGGETAMLRAYWNSGMILDKAQVHLPLAADIVTDSSGCKAKVRGMKRYGHYAPPPNGTFYYRIRSQEEVWSLNQTRHPVAFEDFVEPIGYTLPLDSEGGLKKVAINSDIETDIVVGAA